MTNTKEFLQQFFADETIFFVNEAVSSKTNAGKIKATQNRQLPEQQQTKVFEKVNIVKSEQAITPEPSAWIYKQKVLILVSEPKLEFLSDTDAELLQNILKAVNLTLDEVDLLNVDTLETSDFKPMLATKVVHHVITFGIPMKRLQLEILLAPYQIKKVEGVNFLFADPLPTLHQDKNRKKALWECLQKMFGIISKKA